jgi:hypothetical protein
LKTWPLYEGKIDRLIQQEEKKNNIDKKDFLFQIPPRIMFITQIVATVVACVVNLMTAMYLIDTIPNICTEKNIEWRCPISTTFYSASIIWVL